MSAAIAGARVEAGTDFAIADDHGFFTITAPISSSLTIKDAAGGPCAQRAISALVDPRTPALVYRVGKIGCSIDVRPKSVGELVPAAHAEAAAVDGVKDKLQRARADILAISSR